MRNPNKSVYLLNRQADYAVLFEELLSRLGKAHAISAVVSSSDFFEYDKKITTNHLEAIRGFMDELIEIAEELQERFMISG